MAWFDKKPIIALAPMADMTDSPFCRVCREVSGNDFVIFREMVSAEAIVRDSEKTLRMCAFEKEERPIVLQIFGANPDTIAQAAKIVVDKFHPDGVDINMGCPVPKIAGKNLAGAALMKDPERAVKIVEELKKMGLGVPISVKTRLGWAKNDEILTIASRLEAAGADLLTIHGRTKGQGYGGQADWEMIGRVKKILKIPVIANGDIKSRGDIQKCLAVTGADGVMIGRAALGNPWIFGDGHEVTLSERIKVVLRHAHLHVEHYGDTSMVTFRKHLLQYFRGDLGIDNQKELKNKLAKINSLEELENLLFIQPEFHYYPKKF